jgi:hypothetical protein
MATMELMSPSQWRLIHKTSRLAQIATAHERSLFGERAD